MENVNFDNLSIYELCELIGKGYKELQQYRAIGTVEEFKALKQGNCTNECEHYDSMIEYVRNDAIEEFAERICVYGTFDHYGNAIDVLEIAESMKGKV